MAKKSKFCRFFSVPRRFFRYVFLRKGRWEDECCPPPPPPSHDALLFQTDCLITLLMAGQDDNQMIFRTDELIFYYL